LNTLVRLLNVTNRGDASFLDRDTRKVEYLLAAFERARVHATYLALDISKASLTENVRYLASKHCYADSVVRCAGLWGTFADGEAYVRNINNSRLFLSLGSVLCNDAWDAAQHNLSTWAKQMRPDDLMLVGMDAHVAPRDNDKIWAAYHSCDSLFKRFFLTGFQHANRLAGENWFREQDWDFLAQLEEHPSTRHRFYFRAKRDIKLQKFARTIEAGEEFDWFDSHKYSEQDVRLMCAVARLDVVTVWQAPVSEFRKLPSLLAIVERLTSRSQVNTL
jgi:uncharacterized SAM-dependent methyltransferase